MLVKIYRNISSFVPVLRTIKASQCKVHKSCLKGQFSYTQAKFNPEYTRKKNKNPALQVELQLYFPLSDNHGQVDKQISGDAANLPVLTNWKYDGTALPWNMWHVSAKWKVCHTRVSLQRPQLKEAACAVFYTPGRRGATCRGHRGGSEILGGSRWLSVSWNGKINQIKASQT